MEQNEFAILSVQELRMLCRGRLSLSRTNHKRAELLQRIFSGGTLSLLNDLKQAALAKSQRLADLGKEKTLRKKRKVQDTYDGTRQRRKVEASQDISQFLTIPDDKGKNECYRRFYVATSKEATEIGVCAICAREMGILEGGIKRLNWKDIPNKRRLVPKNKHAAHHLFEGCLLEPRAVYTTSHGGVSDVDACKSCVESLHSTANFPPPLSLANNLWVGMVPWELRRLTVPEQMLIALLYPKVYVFKLFPKFSGQGLDPSTLQQAMRGTISTYDLDVAGAANMIQGNLLPRKLPILASLVSITFISVAVVPHRWLRSLFRVRRQVVYEALAWLKKNNPKYYRMVEISQTHMSDLPEDDVPREILAVVRHSTDVAVLDQEEGGYVANHSAPLSGEHGTLSAF